MKIIQHSRDRNAEERAKTFVEKIDLPKSLKKVTNENPSMRTSPDLFKYSYTKSGPLICLSRRSHDKTPLTGSSIPGCEMWEYPNKINPPLCIRNKDTSATSIIDLYLS
jgi:hypothetical protein